jgi:hypothetical protein
MSDYTQIDSLNLGNTFGAWYAKTNEMITRLNLLKVGGITGGDGILVRPQTSTQGGYTLDIANTITKDVTFNGNVTVNGILSSSFGGDVSGINVVLPANTGVTVGNIVYLDSTGKLEKALANDECTSEVVGVVVGFTGGNAQVATAGKITGSTIISNFLGTVGATLQKGVVYFLSGGVSGAGTTLEPDVTDYVSKPMLLGLTGNSGLILPYRGYIGLTLSNGSSNNVVVGVSGAVTSLNGISASLWNLTSPQLVSRLKTTGNLHALHYIGLSVPSNTSNNFKWTKALELDFRNTFTQYGLRPMFDKVGGIPATVSGSFLGSSTNNGQEATYQFCQNINSGFIFSTNGTLDDVYKITKIKIIPEINEYSTFEEISPLFTFSLQKEYNSIAGTTLINFGMQSAANEGNPQSNMFKNLRLELRKHGYSITKGTLSPGIPTYTTEVTTAEIIKPDINNQVPFSLLNTTVTTVYGVTSGTVDGNADINGSFPIIYPSIGYRTRPQSFTINNIVLSGTNISKYIKSSVEWSVFDDTSDLNGYTMDSSILGWNARYGAIPESVYFVPVSLISVMPEQPSGCNINIITELYKYDTTTRLTTGSPILLSSKFTLSAGDFYVQGVPATGRGSN